MITVKPGQKLPLSYVFPHGDAGKVVKATVEKLSGALVATVTLTEASAGDQMNNTFAMPVGVDFLKAKFTPYLSDGVTIDTTNEITQEIFAVITPIFVSEIKVVLGCIDQPAQHPVLIAQPSDKNVLLSFKDDDGNPIDTASATVVSFKLLKLDGTTMDKNLSSGITPVVGKLGQYLVQFVAADLALLPDGDLDAQVTLDLSGVHNVMQVLSALSVQPSVLSS